MPSPRSSSSPVYEITDRFGGVARLAGLLFPDDPKGLRRVRDWVNERMIPAWYFDAVVDAAKRVNVKVTHAELSALARAARGSKAA